jgi:hypothetical protein
MFQEIEHTNWHGAGKDAEEIRCVLVRTRDELSALGADILGDRDYPVVGLTLREYEEAPVLPARDVRSVVGSPAQIYLVADDELLRGLGEMVGARLRLDRGSARIWWPGCGARRCDPADHPAVFALESEALADTLEDFCYQFDLTRPRVRGRINLIEDGSAFLQHELDRAHEQTRKIQERLRDAQIEGHRQRTRAEAAEERLAAVLGSVERALGSVERD